MLLDDCFRPDRPRLTHDEAIAALRARVAVITELETVPLAAAAGRCLAQPIVAQSPVPAHTNAAVDGYAFAFESYDAARGSSLSVAGRAAAGHPLTAPTASDTAVRIFTGAVLPPGCDSVVMQEDVTVDTAGGRDRIAIGPGLKKGANVRRAGEDVATGAELFRAGGIIRPQDLAALASIGVAEVPCRKRLNLAIVSTGDEVVLPGARPLAAGEVYDANAPMLRSLAALAGADVTDLGIWPDKPDEIRRRLAEAAETFDVILTSGGASRGEEDHMAGAIDTLGRRHFWQLAVKPGRPMMFGQIRGRRAGTTREAIVIGLPGNPVAVFVCFLMYVFPMLRALGGAGWPEPRRIRVPATFAFTGRKTGRREFWRGMLTETNATLGVDKFARDGSGLISGLRAADCLIDIPEDAGDVAVGDLVAVIPFSDFGIPRG